MFPHTRKAAWPYCMEHAIEADLLAAPTSGTMVRWA